jgi:hypothetical protein
MGTFSHARTIPIRRRLAVASLSALALAGVICGGTATAQASDRASNQALAGPGCPSSVHSSTATTTSTISSASWTTAGVPWRSVGKGWILADLAKSAGATAPGTLYLVSPAGQRYRLGTAPGGSDAFLADWSGNGANALFMAQSTTSTTATIIVLNLRTGKGSSFTMYSGSPFASISFTRPSGTAILVQTTASPEGGYLPLQRFSLTGTRELCYPVTFPRAGSTDGSYLESANGTELVISTQNGMELVSNAGQPIRPLALRGQYACQLLNWWNSQTVLGDCSGQLLAFPLSGGTPDQLTTSRDPGTFLGAWHLPSGTYAEAAACGTTWLEKLNPTGTATDLTIPGAATAGTVRPLGTYGNQLPLLIGGGCDTRFAYSMIDWYNPAANTAKTVIGGPAGDGYVTAAVLYPTP